ncbi:MAG: hypothetical protein ACRC3Z_13295 [Phocaeicola sp.]
MKKYPSSENEQFYYAVVTLRIQLHLVEGDTEYARYAIADMLEEAEAMNSNEGRFYGYFLQVVRLSKNKSNEVDGEILRYLKLADAIPHKSENQQSWMASRYYLYYLRIGDNEQARESLERENELLKRSLERRKTGSIYATLVRNYARMASLVPKEDAQRRLHYLQQGQLYYPESTFLGYNLRFLEEWADYYYDQQQWQESLAYYQQVLDRGKGRTWQYLSKSTQRKAALLEKMDSLPQAVQLYGYIVQQKDSLNRVLQSHHQEAIAQNYQIKELLKKQMRGQNTAYGLLLLGLFLLLAMLAYVALKLVRSERQIRSKRGEIKRLYLEMEQKNSEKSAFIKRIVKQIEPQLQEMVQSAQWLRNLAVEGSSLDEGSEVKLSSEMQQLYADRIREQARAILNLVMGVLELSRLEVKRVSYTYERNCLVTLLERLVGEIQNEAIPNYHLVLDEATNGATERLERWQITTDWSAINKVLYSLLHPRYTLSAPVQTHVALRKEAEWVVVVITHTPLNCFTQGEESGIVHQINQLTLNQLGGSYALHAEAGAEPGVFQTITLRLPL